MSYKVWRINALEYEFMHILLSTLKPLVWLDVFCTSEMAKLSREEDIAWTDSSADSLKAIG